jgi:quercetin dioxygenase-like cupin family protein
MSSRRKLLCAALLAAVASVSPPAWSDAVRDADGFVTLKLGQEEWKDYPGITGIQYMLVDGDLHQPGPYVIRVKFSPGVMTRPHFHPEDRLATVLKGTWWSGTGDNFDPASTIPLPPGSFMKHPAREPHYDGAKDEEVILQIIGVGPSGTTFLKPDLGPIGPSR